MFEPILMDFLALSAKRTCINLETKQRTYCCGRGRQQSGGVGSRKTFSGWDNKTISWGWGGKTLLEDDMAKYFGGWMAKHFG